MNYLEILKKVAAKSRSLLTFTVKNRVDSCAFALDRRIVLPGDLVEIIRWHCINGPTEIRIKKRSWDWSDCGSVSKTCVFANWIDDMGAPDGWKTYMPFAPKTWDEVIAENS